MTFVQNLNFFPVIPDPTKQSRLHILRGLLAAGIVWHHLGPPPVFLNIPFSVPGRIIVWLFYSLSGFLIGQGFLDGRYRTDRKSVSKFMFRRLLRIVPLLYFACFFLAITRLQPEQLTLDGVRKILFLSYSFDQFPLVGPAWFLGPLVQLYLISPWLFLVLKKNLIQFGTMKVFYGILIASVLLQYVSCGVNHWLGINDGKSFIASFDDRTLLGNLSPFLMGAMAVPLLKFVPDLGEKKNFMARVALIVTACLSVMYFALPKYFWVLPTVLPVSLAALAAIIWAVSAEDKKSETNLCRKFLLTLGTLSYGIFLWHDAVIHQIRGMFPSGHGNYFNFIGIFTVVLTITVMLAYTTYCLIERPLTQTGIQKV